MIDLNLNQSQCIREKIHFFESVYHNVCTGEVYSIDHTALEYFCGGIIGALLAFCILIVLHMLFIIFRP